MNFRLNRKGGSEVLKQIAVAQVNVLARRVAGAAGEDARMDEYTTDRAAAAVSVPAHSQATDGVLTKAAAAAGLEVRPQ